MQTSQIKRQNELKPTRRFWDWRAGGSWISGQMDEFSDIDLVLITKSTVSDSLEKMKGYAEKIGPLLNAFTGEHVGEKRLLICLYDTPLLHVDIKFVTLEEFRHRVENPVILWDKDGSILKILQTTSASWPAPDFQWIEDRFWTWVHYAALKLGRGEIFEALDFLSFLRTTVLAPLLQIKNKQLPQGLRRIEQNFRKKDLATLKKTIPVYSPRSVCGSLDKTIELYRNLRTNIFKKNILLRSETENKCMEYYGQIKLKILRSS